MNEIVRSDRIHTDVAVAYVGSSQGDLPDRAEAWLQVELALYDHFHEPDVEAARAFYAALAAHYLMGQPVWPMIVAPPGCGKTELINPLKWLPNVHLIDSITPNTLISGRAPEPGKQRGKEGLLERIGTNGMIFIPDFSTLLEGNRDKRDQVFSQFRRLYDGDYRKEFGIADLNTSWSGRLTVGVAVTPKVDRYLSLFNSLGDRFVMIRWKRVAGVEAARKAMQQDHAAKNAAMQQAVARLFEAMSGFPEPEIPDSLADAVGAMAEIIARGRTAVERERDDTIAYVPEPEGATRLAQQFCQLARGSARLEGKPVVDNYDLGIVHRVAFDTLHPHRAAVLRALLAGKPPAASGVAVTTLRRVVEDLEQVGLLHRGQFTDEARGLFAMARLLDV